MTYIKHIYIHDVLFIDYVLKYTGISMQHGGSIPTVLYGRKIG